MSQTELLTNITQAIRDVVNNQSLVVTEQSRLVSDLGLESIDLLDVSSELENTIGQELDFKDVAEYVAKKANQAPDVRNMRVADLMEYISAQN